MQFSSRQAKIYPTNSPAFRKPIGSDSIPVPMRPLIKLVKAMLSLKQTNFKFAIEFMSYCSVRLEFGHRNQI